MSALLCMYVLCNICAVPVNIVVWRFITQSMIIILSGLRFKHPLIPNKISCYILQEIRCENESILIVDIHYLIVETTPPISQNLGSRHRMSAALSTPNTVLAAGRSTGSWNGRLIAVGECHKPRWYARFCLYYFISITAQVSKTLTSVRYISLQYGNACMYKIC